MRLGAWLVAGQPVAGRRELRERRRPCGRRAAASAPARTGRVRRRPASPPCGRARRPARRGAHRHRRPASSPSGCRCRSRHSAAGASDGQPAAAIPQRWGRLLAEVLVARVRPADRQRLEAVGLQDRPAAAERPRRERAHDSRSTGRTHTTGPPGRRIVPWRAKAASSRSSRRWIGSVASGRGDRQYARADPRRSGREIRSAAPARAGSRALVMAGPRGLGRAAHLAFGGPEIEVVDVVDDDRPELRELGSASGAAQLVQGADADVQVRGGFTNPKPATALRLPVDAVVRAQLRVFTRVHVTAPRTAANAGPAKSKRLPEIGVTISPQSRRDSISWFAFVPLATTRPRPFHLQRCPRPERRLVHSALVRISPGIAA